MDLSQFNYHLPEKLIAQIPTVERTQSQLLHVSDQLLDLPFVKFNELLNPGDLLIMNNTKVLPARMFGVKPTGGKIELLLERVLDEQNALVQLKSNKRIKTSQVIEIAPNFSLIVKQRDDRFFVVEFVGMPVFNALHEYGSLPLPPYVKRPPDKSDLDRYQTVYAKADGAVAAPTAGLHFNEQMLRIIRNAGIAIGELTLHVGAGTFVPVNVQDITQHKMHKERYEINQTLIDQIKQVRQSGGRIIAIGTTTVRALEGAFKLNKLAAPVTSQTDIFIYPGFSFEVVDALLTNFHLPKSTLLMMVSAFAGTEKIKQAYRHAVESEYRFFSYGDAMFLEKAKAPNLS